LTSREMRLIKAMMLPPHVEIFDGGILGRDRLTDKTCFGKTRGRRFTENLHRQKIVNVRW